MSRGERRCRSTARTAARRTSCRPARRRRLGCGSCLRAFTARGSARPQEVGHDDAASGPPSVAAAVDADLEGAPALGRRPLGPGGVRRRRRASRRRCRRGARGPRLPGAPRRRRWSSSTPATTSPRRSAPATRSAAAYPVRLVDVTPRRTVAEQDAEYGPRLYERNPDRCCALRKVEPLERGARAATARGSPGCAARTRRRARDARRRLGREARRWSRSTRSRPGRTRSSTRYVEEHGVLVNPLLQLGYPSIGCAPVHPRAWRPARTPGRAAGRGGPRPSAGCTHEPPTATSAVDRAADDPAGPAGVRGHPHPPRGRRRVRAAGAAVQRRQGLDRPARTSRSRRSGRAACRSRCCTSTPGTTSPRSSRSGTGWVAELGLRLLVASVEESIARRPGRRPPGGSRNPLQTVTLLDAIAEHRFDAVFGGARRDEEKARAKERVFSLRDEFGQWDPRRQRPELWDLYNGRHRPGEHVRVFPLSNWTELDVWSYIERERIDVPEIYFAHERRGVPARRHVAGGLAARARAAPGEELELRTVRYRTVGDVTCTGAVESTAATVAGGRRRDRRDPGHRARRHPRRRPGRRGRDGGPQAGGLLLMGTTCCASPRPARWTTASPPCSAGCCTTRRGSSPTSSTPSRPRAPAARWRARSTSRCSPTACAPSASRASPSTSPTATSRRRAARSSSPTPPATSSTRGTWSPAPRPPTSRSCSSTSGTGSTEQSRRHAAIAALLRVPHVVLVVNKMDLVGWDAAAFERVVTEFRGLRRRRSVSPTSPRCRCRRCTATTSSTGSRRTPWYAGPDPAASTSRRSTGPAPPAPRPSAVPRAVRRPAHPSATTAGTPGGSRAASVRPGDEVVVLPVGRADVGRPRVETYDGPLHEARRGPVGRCCGWPTTSTSARGDLLAPADDRAAADPGLRGDRLLAGGGARCAPRRYLLKHTHPHDPRPGRGRADVLDLGDGCSCGPPPRARRSTTSRGCRSAPAEPVAWTTTR